MSIYDLVLSSEIVAYWEGVREDEQPYLFEELFPSEQKLGLRHEWLVGAGGIPVVLKPSAFDAAAIPRSRIGFDRMESEMPFFKESMYIDEELRQQLNMVIETNNQAYIDMILTQIFNDEISLLKGARAQRERMRAMMVTTGTIVMEGNGQVFEYDYHLPENHKVTVTKSWSDPTASILDDIRTAIQTIRDDTGVTLERAVTTSKVLGYFRKNNEIRTSLIPLTAGEGFISDTKILQFISDELKINIATYDYKYKDESLKEQSYIPDNVFVLIPSGNLGRTMFGTTPEQSDLMSGRVSNVTITDTGVAVTTSQKVDPVNVMTKVTQICLPDFPTAKQVFIYDTEAAKDPEGP